MFPISAPTTLVAQALACIDRSRIILHTQRTRNRQKQFQLRSMVVCAVTVNNVDEFPSFLPREVVNIKDSAAREMATRIQRLPVQTNVSEQPIMSSCVMPIRQNMEAAPVVLLHGFDRMGFWPSCGWIYLISAFEHPVLVWSGVTHILCLRLLPWSLGLLIFLVGASILEKEFNHLAWLQNGNIFTRMMGCICRRFWRNYIKRPMVLVGPSLGAAAAVDFAVFYPEAVSKLVLIDASVYAEGTGNMEKFPKKLAYAGVSLLKSIPLRAYANLLAFHSISIDRIIDFMNVGRLHCLLPRWEDATVDFMLSGGYKVAACVKEIEKKTLVIWGEDDKIVSKEYAKRLHNDLKESKLQYISKCGHIPHVEKPDVVTNMITDFLKYDHAKT